jgi:hypothetical protein
MRTLEGSGVVSVGCPAGVRAGLDGMQDRGHVLIPVAKHGGLAVQGVAGVEERGGDATGPRLLGDEAPFLGRAARAGDGCLDVPPGWRPPTPRPRARLAADGGKLVLGLVGFRTVWDRGLGMSAWRASP